MQEAAARQEWDTVSQLERERLSLFEELFSHSFSKQDSDEIRRTMTRIIDIDESILNLAAQAKAEIHSQAKQLLLEKHAFEEYAKNR